MFKAFLRTDGVVVVSGGDVAWTRQRKSFQRYCTKLFADKLESLPNSTRISDFSPKLRTLVCEVYDFVGEPLDNISDSDYQYYRSVLLRKSTTNGMIDNQAI